MSHSELVVHESLNSWINYTACGSETHSLAGEVDFLASVIVAFELSTDDDLHCQPRWTADGTHGRQSWAPNTGSIGGAGKTTNVDADVVAFFARDYADRIDICVTFRWQHDAHRDDFVVYMEGLIRWTVRDSRTLS